MTEDEAALRLRHCQAAWCDRHEGRLTVRSLAFGSEIDVDKCMHALLLVYSATPILTRTSDAFSRVCRVVVVSDAEQRLGKIRMHLGCNVHTVRWCHERRRTRRGWTRGATVQIGKVWPADKAVSVGSRSPDDADKVSARIAGTGKPWWGYVWETVRFADEAEAVVFGVAQAAWYCLRKERSIREGMPTYTEAARRGLAFLADYREGRELGAWA